MSQANLCPTSASRAHAGDALHLVFYHSHGHSGYAFHVGMYVSRGRTVAAVDPAEGVTWQRINFADASFGSFTHR